MKRLIALSALAITLYASAQQTDTPPLVYDTEVSAVAYPAIALPPIDSLPAITHLPEILKMADGSPVNTLDEWEKRRDEIMQQLYHYEIGQKPVTPRDSIEAVMDADTLRVTVHGAGNALEISAPIFYPEGDGPFPAIIGIFMPSGSLPPQIFTDRGIAMIAFDFTDVMSHTQKRGEEPINAIYPELEHIGAYAAWPWGISRLIDGLEIVGDSASRIDRHHLAVSGCSFAGKMALFAGALDRRIALTIAQEPGGGGAASWRVSETLGEVETVARTNYSWFMESMRQFADRVDRLPVDHHELVALVAPRALLVLGNTDYPWLADQSGYVSCVVARDVWDHFGVADRMGYTIEGNHPHCQVPDSQIPEIEAFVDRFLLGIDTAPTSVTRAPMFDSVDLTPWKYKKDIKDK